MKPAAWTHGMLVVVAFAASAQSPQPVLVLEDVRGRSTPVRLDAPHDRLVILCSDREGSRHAPRWLAEIRAAGSGLPVLEIANLAGVPAIARPVVRRAFRDAGAVLLDWRGEVGRRYGFVPGHVNVYLIGPDGTLLFRTHGAESSVELARFISALRNEGLRAPEPAR